MAPGGAEDPTEGLREAFAQVRASVCRPSTALRGYGWGKGNKVPQGGRVLTFEDSLKGKLYVGGVQS